MKNQFCNSLQDTKKVVNRLLSECKLFLNEIDYSLLIEEMKYYKLEEINKEVIRLVLYSVLGLRYEETRIKRIYLTEDLQQLLFDAKNEDIERKSNLPNLANFILNVTKYTDKQLSTIYNVTLSKEIKVSLKYIRHKYGLCNNVDGVLTVMNNTTRNKKQSKIQPLKLSDYQFQYA